MKRVLLSATLLSLAASACAATYDHTDVKPVSVGDQLMGSISQEHATVPVAGVVVAHIAPFNSDSNPMVGDVVSSDETIMKVLRSQGDKNYALLGVSSGSVTLKLLADGIVVTQIPAEVTAQP